MYLCQLEPQKSHETMSNFKLELVSSHKQENEWLDFPKKLYKGNPYWVCPFDNDIKDVFNPAKNQLFNNGQAVRWVVRNEKNEIVGRIAAFYNKEQAAIEEQPTGGCGFFEAIDNQEVANMLFDAAKEWLIGQGMEAMDGPINFGARDDWWGVLVKGFESQPLYKNPYNFPYYQQLFENYGFQVYFNQHTYSRKLEVGQLSPAVYSQVKRLSENPAYRFEHITPKDYPYLAERFRTIYNKAWSKFSGIKPFSKEDTDKIFNSLRPIIDPHLIYFAYYNDQPIGFYIMIPDLNRIIGRFNGKFGLINKLRFLLMMKMHKADRIFGLIFGVTPEFQGRGIESGIIHAFEQDVLKGKDRKYKSLELAWVGDFNPVMMRMVETYVCAERFKMHTTYRYLFDRTKEFKRCPRLSIKKD